jgi:hypothetical protein
LDLKLGGDHQEVIWISFKSFGFRVMPFEVINQSNLIVSTPHCINPQ